MKKPPVRQPAEALGWWQALYGAIVGPGGPMLKLAANWHDVKGAPHTLVCPVLNPAEAYEPGGCPGVRMETSSRAQTQPGTFQVPGLPDEPGYGFASAISAIVSPRAPAPTISSRQPWWVRILPQPDAL
ncbi:uncharacterized protein CTHT_0053470 [Thermochaetoides thermophila DSM 1495]|uniref:Uncharacterized protein n=1 Tax=Chaetomium thermophilum (strain DSM 1495 / CBS 144.50 / IMI 039719) TaxID=759272 RepID=G0SDY7_CHATD|nr:hypothetical protein CTHT_0053470 [Thermochaetoides thermophila DSM 1495]EGS18738.1 hypothetical protein CTHT_0053470 [Thermochaetoides thermophila DSM 1495]